MRFDIMTLFPDLVERVLGETAEEFVRGDIDADPAAGGHIEYPGAHKLLRLRAGDPLRP